MGPANTRRSATICVRYQAKPVGAAATDKAEQVARTLFDAAVARIAP